MGKRRTISFTVDDFEYEEILFCSKVGGYGGKSPVSSYVRHLVIKETKKIKGYESGQANRVGIGSVYIIQAGENGPVKIGFSITREAKKRIAAIQQASPYEIRVVKILENCTYKTEKDLHKKYEKYRIHGEWFDPLVLKEILTVGRK